MNTPNSLPNIAFLGIGLMGRPMTIRLLHAGYRVTVWNRTSAKASAMTAYGALSAPSPEEAVLEAEIVITMLASGPIVDDVLEMALPGLQPRTLVIDMSSTRQSEAQDLQKKLARHAVAFMDAPVSGGVVGAEHGNLAIMAGGNADDFTRAEHIFDSMGKPTLVGSVGCGQLAKLCNQLIVGGTLHIVAEALLLAQAGGADPSAVRAAMRGGFAESRILDVHGQRMLERNFLPGGQVKSQTKDLENVLVAATTAGIRLPVTERVTKSYRSMSESMQNADQSAVLLALERLNPNVRVGCNPDKLPD